MSEPAIIGVIFDLDGTLYTLRGLRPLMAVSLWRSIGVLRHLSGARHQVRGREFPDGEMLREAFLEELARRAAIDRGRADSWYRESFLPVFVSILERHGRRRPGLIPWLARLRTGGVRLAVVSDFPVVAERLRALGIPPEAFHRVCSTEEVGALKPSPRALEMVADEWGLEPERVIVVGDRSDLDEASARAARMEFVGLEQWGKGLGGEQGYVSWREAREIIAIRTGIGVER